MKAINLEMPDGLYGKVKRYAKREEVPVVQGIRSILRDFFKHNPMGTDKNEELPDGVVDMGEGQGYALDMEKFRDKDGTYHVPPADLTKEQSLDWIKKNHNGLKN